MLVTGRCEVVAAGATALGVVDVVAKPFDVTDLLERVARAIESNEAPRAA